jgi:hypothetical protein
VRHLLTATVDEAVEVLEVCERTGLEWLESIIGYLEWRITSECERHGDATRKMARFHPHRVALTSAVNQLNTAKANYYAPSVWIPWKRPAARVYEMPRRMAGAR